MTFTDVWVGVMCALAATAGILALTEPVRRSLAFSAR
jgi:hypothetical protein